jgi:hypothetical protein
MTMPTATLERPSFPKTVSACHAEIIRLRGASEGLVGESDRIAELEAEVTELKESLSAMENEIDVFLYEVERPIGGGFKFNVIHGASTDRAILSMFDAVGRRP